MRINSLRTAFEFLQASGLPVQLEPSQALLGWPIAVGCHLFLSWPPAAEVLSVAVSTPLRIVESRLLPTVALALMGENRRRAAATWILDAGDATVDYRTYLHLETDGAVSGELLLRVLIACQQIVPTELPWLERLCAGEVTGPRLGGAERTAAPDSAVFSAFSD